MTHPARHTHTWSHLMSRFAQAVGATDYRFGPLRFSRATGPSIVAELLDEGRALGLTVDLQHVPEDERLEDFLAANRVDNAPGAGVYALHGAPQTLLFFRRLEDAGRYAYEDLMREIQAFERTALAARDALPNALVAGALAPAAGDTSASHADSFRHVWSDLVFSQGLGRELPDAEPDGSYVLLLEGAGHVFVRPDLAHECVVLTLTLAPVPLLGDEPPSWRTLLQAHTLGQATGGAVFAIDLAERALIAWRSLPLGGLDAYGLNDAIDSLAEVVRFYTDALALDTVPA